MKKFRRYISLFLLIVIAWVSTPAHTIHDIFADHEAEDDFYCSVHHADMGIHFDEAHGDCDIFKIDAPSFTEPNQVELSAIPVLFSEKSFPLSVYHLQNDPHSLLSSRAPPVKA